ncbi:MAG TPA: hypothetical protein VIJ16_03195 [Gemmatimonadaceae bacterium]
MSSEETRAALAALGAARVAIARLDVARPPDALAADLMAAWGFMEDGLRNLLGGSSSAGTELVREARQRQLLTFDQANALAAFYAARERVRDGAYRAGAADLEAARQAMAALDSPPAEPASAPAMRAEAHNDQPAALSRGGPPTLPAPLIARGAPRSHARRWITVIVLVVAAALAAGAYYWYGGPRRDAVVRQAIGEYETGNTQAATADFRRAVLIDPNYALSHVYLARMARDAGNLAGADAELQLALTADPTNALALREMGAYLFAAGNYELARKFYVRAVTANPEDAAAEGNLGCTLVKLGRIDEGERWITRAGPGRWTSCVNGTVPPDTLH